MRRGLTLVEILVVIAIVATLTAIVLPVFYTARAIARQESCLTNINQLGTAMHLYAQDFEDTFPRFLAPPDLYSDTQPYTNRGWAGRIYPYVKDARVFRCIEDSSHGDNATNTVPVSYAINMNLAEDAEIALLTAPRKTVMFVEIKNCRTRLDLPDEGESQGRGIWPYTLSPSAGGMASGFLISVSDVPPLEAFEQGKTPQYATGVMDNIGLWENLDYTKEGRYKGGANVAAADGHVRWVNPKLVSAGYSAKKEDALQSATGCENPWGDTDFPCAEGTAVGKHLFTFSTR